MVIALSIAVGVLAVSLAVLMCYALGRELSRSAAARSARKEQRAARIAERMARDAGRVAKEIAAIHAEDWKGPPVDLAYFTKLWRSLASYLEIKPALMRPYDKVDDLMAGATEWGPDGLDLIEFFLDFLPHIDPEALLHEVAHDEEETVEDILAAVIVRRKRL